MFVKICGTTNLEDARLAAEAGADALGFIFAPSKRRVTAEAVAEITRELPANLLLVGVFTQPEVEEIVPTLHLARLAAVQMHWRYDPQVVAALHGALEDVFQLWQVVGFPVDPDDTAQAEAQFAAELRAALLDPRLDCILLDAVKGGASGGLGQAFSWRRAAALIQPLLAETRQMQEESGLEIPRLILAGGLNAENVGEAVQSLQPWGVDVVSGVEAGPGQKSPDRLTAFFASVRPAS